ncbi:hypothetical protein ACHAWF_014673 [Thalassiosira exigua]
MEVVGVMCAGSGRFRSSLLAFLVLCIVVPTAPFAIAAGSAAAGPPLSGGAASAAFSRTSAGIKAAPASSSELRATATATSERRNGDGGAQRGESDASRLSKLLYTYVNPLLDVASRRRLESTDALRLDEDSSMESAVSRLESVYTKCKEKAKRRVQKLRQTQSTKGSSSRKKPSELASSEATILAKALLRSQKSALALTGVLRLLNTLVQAFPALIIARLLRQIESGTALHPSRALKSALLLVTVLGAKTVVENAYFHNVVKCACQVRGSLAGMIFDKSLRLSSSGRGGGGTTSDDGDGAEKEKGKKASATELGSGGVLNLMQFDATNIEQLTMQLHTVWDGLLQIVIYISLLYRYLGPPVIWGVSVLITTIPLNATILRMLNRLNAKEMESKDARMRKTTESVANMSLLKLQSWEGIFAREVESHREEELRKHAKRGAIRALNQAVSNAVPTITLVATLYAYAKTGRPIVASTIFTAISLFNQLRFPLFFYPMLIDSMANGRNSVKRISDYLAREEIAPYVEYRPKLQLDGGGEGGSIELSNGNFLWSANEAAAAAAADGQSGNNDQIRAGVPALSDASITIRPGEVVAVVGEVGSGKTALAKALIGELVPASRPAIQENGNNIGGMNHNGPESINAPRVTAHGSIAYCAQEAWLPKGTIRDSVVFGREYDEEKYLRAIRAAGLDEDIISTKSLHMATVKQGLLTHDTDVGEGGSNLSGGQRARVALARALYDESAGCYVLDDPLSALDASVGSKVFERVTEKVRKEKSATLFVTNDPNLPRRCDRVVLMGSVGEQSRIIDAGTYDELISRGHDLRTIVHHHDADHADNVEDDKMKVDGHATGTIDADAANSIGCTVLVQRPSLSSSHNFTEMSDCHADPDRQDPALIVDPDAPQAIDDTTSEQKQTSADDAIAIGAVPRSTYATYFKSVKSPLLIAGALLSYLLSNGVMTFQQLIIAKWTDAGNGGAIAAAISAKYLNKLILAAGVVSMSMYLRSYLMMRVGVRASRNLHEKMLESVFQAPLSFFSATPSGQLLTRFGKELEVVDRALPDGIASVLYCFLQIFFSTLALAGAVTPLMALPLAFVSLFYVKIMGRFRPAARDLKRCESKSRSPIFTQFREALRGAETIRSIPGGRDIWASRHRTLADINHSVYYSVKALDRWLSIRLEALGNGVVFTAAVASVFLTRAGKLKSGSAGWGLTQALSITGLLSWAVRVLTELEMQFMSVTRVSELTDLASADANGFGAEEGRLQLHKKHYDAGQVTTTSPTAQSEADLLTSGWPWRGEVEFNDVYMRYNPTSPLVLRNVNVKIPAGTTLGVVGRTALTRILSSKGSGKSSLLLSLFGLVDVEGPGNITIDGVDIRSMSARGLRDSLSIIPQSPTLFAGTLLYNLDASGQASPEDAWNALESASPELARQFRNSEAGLNTLISEGGENLSQGERQLICLARALLRRSKILVLDEATSSVDSKTDAQVQETIRREFVQKGVTVITVAHRLDTVLGYDRILVLDAGEPVEMGAPNELLQIPGGYLRRLFDADRRNRQRGKRARSRVPS